MRVGHVMLAVGAVAILGAGVWLGQRSSTGAAEVRAEPTSVARPSVAVASAQAASARRPVLTPRAAAVPGLAADLADADPRVRRAAVREVGRGADADPAALAVASRDPDLEVAVVATEALGRLHAAGRVDVETLVARATDPSADERVRVSALNGLGLIGSPRAAELLVDLLARGSLTERASSAILLVHQDPTVAVPALIRGLADAEAQVRGNALEALRGLSRGRDFGDDAAAWQAWWASARR